MHRHLGTLPAAALVLVLASAGALAAGPAGADPDVPEPPVPVAADPGGKAAAAGVENRSEQAEAALATVQSMFAGGGAARVAGSQQEAPDATLALRDLRRLNGSLSGADRAAADAFLARPTDGTAGPFGDPGYAVPEATPVCGPHVCIHYVTSTENAVNLTDAGPTVPNGIPDYVDFTLTTLESVHTTYVTAGYRPPKSDDSSTNDGGSALTDIYLADVGPNTPPGSGGVYGYCTSDDPNFDPVPKVYPYYDASAFCVLDNDYSASQFPHLTPEKNLQVTAAHEYFHAVQFAYDYWEDSWLLEATATWAEDEVFDAINDNRQYLANSPLTRPHVSLDSLSGTHEYGDWIFFRYLSERFPASVGGLPTVVREIWNRVDGAPGGPDRYSMEAVTKTVVARGAKFAALFTRFAAVNRHPKTSYQEGAAYPASPLAGTFGLSGSHRSTGWQFIRLNHLTSAHARVRPAATLTQSDWRLRVNLDAPNTSRGSAATVQVYRQNGAIAIYPITLNTSGDATKVFPFSVKSVKHVEVTLTNASARYDCWEKPGWSCFGIPRDQNLPFEFRATAFRA